LPLRRDLRGARNCLEFREDVLRRIDTPAEWPFVVYPPISLAEKPRIKDHAIDWVVWVATAILIAKMVVEAMGALAAK
jgi:hypothetical protein